MGSSRTRGVDVRILSATNAHLGAEVAPGAFREDLLFRLNSVEIRLPPLRERPEDIPLPAMLFLGRFQRRYRKEIAGFDRVATEALRTHRWPGNVRSLDHVVERSVQVATGPQGRVADLGLAPPAPWPSCLMSSYARLARLPKPRLSSVDVAEWVRRVVSPETRLPVTVAGGPAALLQADAGKPVQLLINLVRNAVDAALRRPRPA